MNQFTPVICRTAADLIAALREVDPATVVYTTEPPFSGIALYPQSDGKMLIGSTRDAGETDQRRGPDLRLVS